MSRIHRVTSVGIARSQFPPKIDAKSPAQMRTEVTTQNSRTDDLALLPFNNSLIQNLLHHHHHGPTTLRCQQRQPSPRQYNTYTAHFDPRLFHARHRSLYVNPYGGASLTHNDDTHLDSLSSREMSSGLPPTTNHDGNDTTFDLNTAFVHPAGLRVARYVVGTYIRAAQHTLPPPSFGDTTHSVPVPSFDLSPDVASLLQTLLALSDSPAQSSVRPDARVGAHSIQHHDHGSDFRRSGCK